MLRRTAIALIVALVLGSLPILSQAATLTQPLRRVDRLLDRSLKELHAVERFVDERHLGVDRTVDQAIRLTREAEKTVDKALAMVRSAGKEKLSKTQGEEIERLITQAQSQLRAAEQMIDRATQKSADIKRLRKMLSSVDREIDEALKLLREVVAGL